MISPRAAMGFTETLVYLLALTGRDVTVSVGAPDGFPPTALAASGRMRGAVELCGDGPHRQEVFYFALEDDGSSGFLVYREAFAGAAWEGGALTLALGPLALTIEPT
jgi:hypothetical protein